VRLVMPLGLCLLPAFVCWGVVPVVMALLGAGPG
ncbi:MAG: secretion system protein, partial [Micrococcus luteus]